MARESQRNPYCQSHFDDDDDDDDDDIVVKLICDCI